MAAMRTAKRLLLLLVQLLTCLGTFTHKISGGDALNSLSTVVTASAECNESTEMVLLTEICFSSRELANAAVPPASLRIQALEHPPGLIDGVGTVELADTVFKTFELIGKGFKTYELIGKVSET